MMDKRKFWVLDYLDLKQGGMPTRHTVSGDDAGMTAEATARATIAAGEAEEVKIFETVWAKPGPGTDWSLIEERKERMIR